MSLLYATNVLLGSWMGGLDQRVKLELSDGRSISITLREILAAKGVSTA